MLEDNLACEILRFIDKAIKIPIENKKREATLPQILSEQMYLKYEKRGLVYTF